MVVAERNIIQNTHRKLIPINRGLEYASKVIAKNKTQLPASAIQYLETPRKLLSNELTDAIQYSAADDPIRIEYFMHSSPVYLDMSRIPTCDPTYVRIKKIYDIHWNPSHPWLGKLSQRTISHVE